MSKLLEHFKRMQAQVALFISPAQYVPFHGKPCVCDLNSAEEKARFIDDVIYMLDGPEQREAQAEAQSMADQGYPTEDAYLRVCRALHWAQGQLRAHGIEPLAIQEDAPHYPPDDHDFGGPEAFAKMFSTPHGQMLYVIDDTEDDDPCIRVRGAYVDGVKPEAVLTYHTEEDRDRAWCAITLEAATETAAQLANAVARFGR